MALTHLLDTSVYSQPIRKRPSPAVQKRWRQLGDGVLCISVICEMEVLQGLETKDSGRLWDSYYRVLENRLPILPVDRSVAKRYGQLAAELRATGRPRPVFDVVIAATALANGLVVATCDAAHFEDIGGLNVEDWSA